MIHQLIVALGLLAGAVIGQSQQADVYDPLRVEGIERVKAIDLVVNDKQRNREIPIRVYLPPEETTEPKPHSVVLFSHGLGGARTGSAFLGKHWAARGYVSVFLQHPGSDEAVWKDEPLTKRMTALREAASAKNFMLRVKDVPAVLDQLAVWNAATDHQLNGQLNLGGVGMSGHSFGGNTTQAVSGQKFPLVGQSLNEQRVKAAIVMSPGIPERGDVAVAFSGVKIPWLTMTGTHDTAAVGNQTPESRRRVFTALPPGDKYQVVLDKGEHSAFTERALPGDKELRNPNHHRIILALSTAFWDAYLRDDAAAKAWLAGDGPRGILQPGDVWEKK